MMWTSRGKIHHVRLPVLLIAGTLLATPAHAYVGPGAGFAFVSSFFILVFTSLLAFLALLTWPIHFVFRTVRNRRTRSRARVRKVVVLGLDGQDPDLTEQFMAEGLLPNFRRLRDEGSFLRLQTSLLAESPVAWSSFATGCNPGKHRIYDFLVPNRKTHLPELSSARITAPRRTFRLGPFRIPIGKPDIAVGRRSKPFWKVLGEHGVFSTIQRVPITFPPEPFHGVLLSAMCLPDLKGSQGTYFYYSSNAQEREELTSGVRIPVEVKDGVIRSCISGPENTLGQDTGEMRLPFEVRISKNRVDAELVLDRKRHLLRKGEYSSWISLAFRPGPGIRVHGICRFLLLETHPHFRLFMTPINIDPARPALPISHPFAYSIYLARTRGTYATLGVAEDTSALNEGVIDEEAFLKQSWMIHEEREGMFFDALEKTNRGLVACVFDATDRLQHMFFRFMEDDHPALRECDAGTRGKYRDEIRRLYARMDDLLGRTMKKIDEDTVLMVMSDHGFKSFRRQVNLNTWLLREGWLVLNDGKRTGADMFQDVDWSRTRAYAVGFGGIYLNLKGREAGGIVGQGGEADALRRRIQQQLSQLTDPENGEKCVRNVYDAREVYRGPYVDQAPDLVTGFRAGYRVAWESVTGGLSDEVIYDNTRRWSGDHNFDPADVPGMLFINRRVDADEAHIMDLGPTVLDLFGVPTPGFCDGRSIMPTDLEAGQ